MPRIDMKVDKRNLGPALTEIYGAGTIDSIESNDEGVFVTFTDGRKPRRQQVPPDILEAKLAEIRKRPPPTRIDPLQEELVDVLAEAGVIPQGKIDSIKRKLNRVR